MTTEVAPCPYDTAIEDSDYPTVRRALGAIADWWDVQVLTSPAQVAAAESVLAAVSAWRAFHGHSFHPDDRAWGGNVHDLLLDAVEHARLTLHVVCGGRR